MISVSNINSPSVCVRLASPSPTAAPVSVWKIAAYSMCVCVCVRIGLRSSLTSIFLSFCFCFCFCLLLLLLLLMKIRNQKCMYIYVLQLCQTPNPTIRGGDDTFFLSFVWEATVVSQRGNSEGRRERLIGPLNGNCCGSHGGNAVLYSNHKS
ncbi:hypothetical protein U1Q18_052818 [Sarracenia purpurea var. burkii]